MAKPAVWVVNHSGGWAVGREGNDRASAVYTTQAEAIDEGRRVAQREKTELFVQGRDGQIRERNSYGHDPYPPRG